MLIRSDAINLSSNKHEVKAIIHSEKSRKIEIITENTDMGQENLGFEDDLSTDLWKLIIIPRLLTNRWLKSILKRVLTTN